MAAKRKTSSRARSSAKRTAKAARSLGISPVLSVLLLLFAFAFVYSGYLEFGNAEVTDAAAESFISKDADLEIHFIDVGQGDCSLIKWDGAAVLIDCGEAEYADTVLAYLKKQDVEKLDYIIVSHPHSDHMGGMSEIIENVEIGKVIAPKVTADMTPTSKVYERFLTALRDKSLKLTAAKPGTVYSLSGRTAEATEKTPPKLEILSPVKDYDDLNNYSVTLKLTYGTTSYLFTGDIEKEAENDILESGADVSADVLKVAHHGSSSSTGEDFFDAVSPEICVIQCGNGNSYGHPHAETMELFKARGVKVFRTDINGTVSIYSDGDEILVRTEKGD